GTAPPQVTSYNFDIAAAGAVAAATSLIYPDGRRVDSTFDRLDRLVARSDFGQGAPIGTYEYLGPDRVAVLTFQNHTRLTHIGHAGGHNADPGFDDDQRIVRHVWEAFTPGTPLGEGNLLVGFASQDSNGNPAYDRADNKLIEEKLHSPDNSEAYRY